MLALGGFLICAALLLLAVFALIARGPDAPRWASAAWAGEAMALAVVSMFALGLAVLLAGMASAFEEGPGLVDLGLLAAVLVVALAIWRWLDVRARLRAIAAAAGAPAGVAGGTAEVPASASERPPSRPTRRAA